MAVSAFLSLLFLANIQVSEQAPCFHGHGCDHNIVDFAACVTQSNWACYDNQFCSLQINKDMNRMDCKSYHEFDTCMQTHDDNKRGCDPRLPSTDSNGTLCAYCCQDVQCINDLTVRPVSTTTVSPTAALTTTLPAPNPGPNNCYTSVCSHGRDNLESCAQGQWACHDHQFCAASILHDGVHLHCTPHYQWLLCQLSHAMNLEQCTPDLLKTTGHVECKYCCGDDQCFQNLIWPTESTSTRVPDTTVESMTDPVTAAEMTTDSVTSTTKTMLEKPVTTPRSTYDTVTSSMPTAYINECFTSTCYHGDDFAKCTSGQWACRNDQFCEVHKNHATGAFSMECLDATNVESVRACMRQLQQYSCKSYEDYLTHDCHFCCPDVHCVMILDSRLSHTSPDTTTSVQPVTSPQTVQTNTSAPATTSSETTTIQETLTTEDLHTTKSLSTTATSSANPPNTSHQQPMTSRLPPVNDRLANCVDVYPGNCSQDFAGRCSDPHVQEICHKTCGTCASTPAQTAQSTTSTLPTTIVISPAICYDCEGLACLLTPTGNQCTADKPLCYTRVTDTHSRQLTRGCIAASECHSPSDTCRTAEARQMADGSECTFCCSENLCNNPTIVFPLTGRYPNWC